MTSQISASLVAKLRKAREKFAKAKPAENNDVANRKVPDGTYTAKLVGLEFSEFGKHPIVRFTWEIQDADKKTHEVAIGEMVETRFNLDTDEGPSFIKRDFAKFGYDDVDNLLDDPQASTDLFGEVVSMSPIVKIAVAMDDTDQFQNVYLNSVMEMDESSLPEADDAEGEEEEEEPVREVADEKKKNKANKGSAKATKKEEPIEEPDEEPADENEEVAEEPDDSDSEAEEGDSEAELTVGDLIETTYKDKEVVGTVVSIDESAQTCKVQFTKEKKRIVVPLESVYLLEG